MREDVAINWKVGQITIEKWATRRGYKSKKNYWSFNFWDSL